MSNEKLRPSIVLTILTLMLFLACESSSPTIQTGQEQQGVPIGKSVFLKAGSFTYKSVEIRPWNDGGAIVDLIIMNGTHRDYNMVMVRVILLGKNGERASQNLPIGKLASTNDRRSIARFKTLDFAVDDIIIEVVDAKTR